MAGAGSYHCPTLLVKLPSTDRNTAEPLVPRDGIFCGQDSRCDLTWTNSLCHRLNEPNRRKGKAVLLKYGVLRSVFSGLMLFFTLAKNQWKGLQGVAAKQWPKCPTSSSGHTELAATTSWEWEHHWQWVLFPCWRWEDARIDWWEKNPFCSSKIEKKGFFCSSWRQKQRNLPKCRQMYFHLAWNQRSWGSVVTFSFSGGWVGCPSQVHGANTRGKCHSLCITVVFSLSASASPAGSCAALWWRNTLLSCWRWRSSLRKKRRGKLFWKCIGDGRQQFSQILKELSIESQNRWDWKRALRSPSPTPLHPHWPWPDIPCGSGLGLYQTSHWALCRGPGCWQWPSATNYTWFLSPIS